jgi:hypothetical protein
MVISQKTSFWPQRPTPVAVARRQHADAVEPPHRSCSRCCSGRSGVAPGEREYEDDAHPGVQNARPHAATEKSGQENSAGWNSAIPLKASRMRMMALSQ